MGRKSTIDAEIDAALKKDSALVKAVDKLTDKASAAQIEALIKFLWAKRRKMK